MKLGLYVISNSEQGYSDEYCYLPVCSSCEEVIEDLNAGNIVADYGSIYDEPKASVPLPVKVDGVSLSLQPVADIYCYHFACDPNDRTRFTAWTRLSNVFKSDQRPRFARDFDDSTNKQMDERMNG